MPTELNPATPPIEQIAPAPAPAAPAPSPELGEGYDKALKAERAGRKSLEDTNALLKQQIAANEAALAASQMTLKEQYEQQIAEQRQAIIDQANAAIAERDAALAERDARLQNATEREQAQQSQQAMNQIQFDFNQAIASLLVNPKKASFFLNDAANELAIDPQTGQTVVINDGQVYGLEALVGYYQKEFPEDFKPPATQKTGGGSRSLASGNNFVQQQQGANLELPLASQITPEQFFANRDRIEKGDFTIRDGK